MKLIILKNNLLVGLNSLERIIDNAGTLPALKGFSLKTRENKIVLIATNLELVIEYALIGKIVEEGELVVPFNIFNNVIKNINSERITLEVKENKQLFITTDNYEAVVQCQGGEEFPTIPDIQNKDQSVKINSVILKDALKNVVVAAGYSEIRPEISGVLFNYDGENLVLAATDNFRLIERTIPSNQIESNFENISIIIPIKAIEEFLRIFNDGDIEINIDSNQILFKDENKELTSRLIDGKFPDYQSIIPKQIKNEIHIDRQEFISAIKLTSSFSGQNNDIAIKIGENEKSLELSSADQALGKNCYKIPIKFKGEQFSVIFNWRYLSDGLKVYKSNEIMIGVNAPDRPAVIRSTSEPFLTYILMPIKT